jgi:hypothetical protein
MFYLIVIGLLIYALAVLIKYARDLENKIRSRDLED